MKPPADALTLPARRGLRLIALELLSNTSRAAERLGSDQDAKALHDFRVALRRLRSWLRAFERELDVSRRDRRTLRDIADATNTGRDAEVELEWLARAGKRAGRLPKRGIGWLSALIAQQQRNAGDPLDDDRLDELAKVQKRLAKKLAKKTKARGDDTLAIAIAEKLPSHIDALSAALQAVRTADDESPAHEARIATKRLRYLLEPVGSQVKLASSVVDRLIKLQDDLGALHDSHVLAHELRAVLAASAATEATLLTNRALGDDGIEDELRIDLAPRDAILAVAERLHRDTERIFGRVKRVWLGNGAAIQKMRRDVDTVAVRLQALDVICIP